MIRQFPFYNCQWMFGGIEVEESQEPPLELLDLPDEVLLLIIGWLGFKSISHLERVCRALLHLCHDPTVWRSLGRRRFVDFDSALCSDATACTCCRHVSIAPTDIGIGSSETARKLTGQVASEPAADAVVCPRAVFRRLYNVEKRGALLDEHIEITQQPTTLRSIIDAPSFGGQRPAPPQIMGNVAPGELSAQTIKRICYVAFCNYEHGPYRARERSVTILGRWFDGGWFRQVWKFDDDAGVLSFKRWSTLRLSSFRSVIMKGPLYVHGDENAPSTVAYTSKFKKYHRECVT
eukprot:TRINITY_DN30753_c0_g1_i1.p1 TRINITY_DN30753_c0_g1~~TRINITY_DN30753_c0_g1_i1.p1  ORF type:complete len:292 (-),score=56.24 TRINITY_DN30753_c0_g1_i1:401-1276(-)